MRALGMTALVILLPGFAEAAAWPEAAATRPPAAIASAAPPRIVLAQKLPSDVEQRFGIRPNSRNADGRGRRGYDDDDDYDDRRRRSRGLRMTECRTRYEERYDPYRGAYVRRPVRECRDW